MRVVKVVCGVLLIVLALLFSIPIMLSTINLLKALISIKDAYGIGFFIGSALGYLLLWSIVFFLIFLGVKLIKPSKKNIMEKLNDL